MVVAHNYESNSRILLYCSVMSCLRRYWIKQNVVQAFSRMGDGELLRIHTVVVYDVC
jgi:hypothetical protein